jgi:SNF2 family DNA or RNA helicase
MRQLLRVAYELRNHRVLVLCPKKLRDNWTLYLAQNNTELNPFLKDRFSYTVLSHTDLSRESGQSGDVDLAHLNWGNFDLVVIDESHNFRNNTRGKRDEDDNIIRSEYNAESLYSRETPPLSVFNENPGPVSNESPRGCDAVADISPNEGHRGSPPHEV